jgi:2-keto-4-pentenoate hydratase/2-oxohepta-3-ene-1,7-dioic acid hydratase in catechol pathway
MNPGAPPDKSKTQPFFFLKTVEGTVIGPDETVHLPSYSQKVDWEAEIAFVIGRTARHVAVEDAMDYIAGYTIVNDLSARDNSRRSDVPFTYDWISHKCFDTSCPMGPWIVPADQIAEPKNLPIKLWVNDRLEQNSNTNDMFFDYAEQIAWLSQRVTLNPGDVVATGTPPGVGMGKGVFLKHGDTVTIEIEGVGRLSNPCVQD